VDATAVAGLDQQLDICVHEGHGHGHIRTVRQDEVGVVTELLDEGEDVVPSSTVETSAVVTQFVDDLRIQSGTCFTGIKEECPIPRPSRKQQ